MKVPNKYRVRHGILASNASYGNNGAFEIPLSLRSLAVVVAADGGGWEHVSVHIRMEGNKERTPTWSEMCHIKNMFWDAEDTVIQYHPPQSQYVNTHPHTLHLWKPIGIEIPLPNKFFV
jgi:hypothetical protein